MDWKSWLKPAASAVGTFLGGPFGGLAGLAAGGIGGYLMGGGGRSNQQQQMGQHPQQMGQQGGYGMMTMPNGSQAVQMPNFSPQQMQGYDQLFQQGQQGMQNMPPANFGALKDMYTQNFNQNTIPGIMERFSGMGAGGQRSSAFEQALGGAGAQMNTQMAGMEQGFNHQNRNQLMHMMQMGGQPQYSWEGSKREPGFAENFGTSLMGGVSAAIPVGVKALAKYYGRG